MTPEEQASKLEEIIAAYPANRRYALAVLQDV